MQQLDIMGTLASYTCCTLVCWVKSCVILHPSVAKRLSFEEVLEVVNTYMSLDIFLGKIVIQLFQFCQFSSLHFLR